MSTLSIGLNILTLFVIWYLLRIIIKTYNAREDRSLTAMDVLRDMLTDNTNRAVNRARNKPKFGDIGDFTGYTEEEYFSFKKA